MPKLPPPLLHGNQELFGEVRKMFQNIKKIFFPRERYLASVLIRLHKLNNLDAEHIFSKYQVFFIEKTVYIKPKLLRYP